jgi:hypothetical protein
VFARGANVAVGAHPAVSPLDRRGTESKLRRLEPCCPLSDKAIVSPIRAGLLLLRCEALIRLRPEDPLSTSHVTR